MKKIRLLVAILCVSCLFASAVALAADLTVYSPQADAERGGWIEEQAEAALGIDIEFLCAGGGELSERLIAEKANPQCDVVLGLVQTAMYQLKDEGILEPFTPAWMEGLPEAYWDPEGYFYSFWQTPIVIAYNADFVDPAPTSWLDLVKPEYQEKYSIGKTTSQTTRAYLLGMMAYFYDEATGDITEEGWEFLRQFFANAYTLPADDTDVWALMKDGSLPINLGWFGGVKSKAALNEVEVTYVTPEEGTPVVAEGIGLVAGCKNPDNAKAFIEWWGSPEFMAAYAAQFGQAPAHPEAIANCPDEVKADAEMFIAQNIDWGAFSSKLDDWMIKIELEIMP